MKKKRFRPYTNVMFQKIMTIYAVILLIFGGLVCNLAYSRERVSSISRNNQIMIELRYKYKSFVENFWKRYMPIFENKDSVYRVLLDYFTMKNKAEMNPMEKFELVNALQILLKDDERMQWIGLYSGKGELNYMLFAGESTLVKMPDDFPFIDELEQKGVTMEVYASKLISHGGTVKRNFALCGGTPTEMKGGKIIMGFSTGDIAEVYRAREDMEESRFFIINDKGVVYDSAGVYECDYHMIREDTFTGFNSEGELVYQHRLSDTGNGYTIFCEIPWISMVLKNHSYTPYIVIIVLVFLLCSLWIYRWMGRVIVGKIDAICVGLKKIGDNELDYRIPVPEIPTDEFESIEQSINEMAIRLQDSIHKEYFSGLKQREAELAELQAKFDPHFLYNTLEIIRGRLYEDGDDETADIIVKLAQIFRGLIGQDLFVSIHEEMEFCNLYLSLLKYRYGNQVTIIYDVDSDILKYGIIRNLLQPILENYFVHGFCVEKKDNRLTIQGKLVDDKYVCFIIKDNGMGITQERLSTLKEKLDTIEPGKKSSYGLRNINKRICLFYGQDCGLRIDCNEDGGATIRVKILKATLKEHERRMCGLDS